MIVFKRVIIVNLFSRNYQQMKQKQTKSIVKKKIYATFSGKYICLVNKQNKSSFNISTAGNFLHSSEDASVY